MTRALHFLMLALAVIASPSPDGPISLGYELRFLDLATYPLAVCNDGSPAAYYFYKGSDPTQWVFHQQGGWWCWDDFSCQVRFDHFANHTKEFRTLMSTKELAALTTQHDMFNGEKNTGLMQHDAATNPMANANKVFLVYCSSDSHAGNRSAGAVPGRGSSKWHFRGKEIVRAALTDLRADGLGEAEIFLLTGGSAGGMATMLNADFVYDLVEEFAPAVKYLTMPDSGFFLDVMPHRLCTNPDSYECKCAAQSTPSDGGIPVDFLRSNGHAWLGPGQTLAQQAQALYMYSNGVVDSSCYAAYGQYGAWRCYLANGALHVEAPTLFLQNQVDEWQGFWNGFFNYSSRLEDYEYMGWFRGRTASALQLLTASSPNVRVFSPNCYHHGLAYTDIFWTVTVDGWTAASMLQALISDTPGVPRAVIDGCLGLPCSPQTVGQEDCKTVPPPNA